MMKAIIDFLTTLPIWVYGTAGGVLLLLIFTFVVLIPRLRYRKNLLKAVKRPDLAGELIRNRYDDAALLQRSAMAIRMAAKLNNDDLPRIIGLDDLWIRRLIQTKHAATMKRILRFAPEKGLFNCFITTLEKPRLAPILNEWFENAKDFLILRKVALSGRGEDFDGKAARKVLLEKIDDLREMAGDPEWASRYFAIKIILHDGSDRSVRVVWDAFADPYPLIRKTVATEFLTDDKERLYENLMELLLKDPIFEVRKTARNRIKLDFAEKYAIDVKELNTSQAQHVLELLQPGVKQDEDSALVFLGGKNLELRLSAALFLSESGVLDRLFEGNDLGDRESLERNYNLLKNSCEVNICGFLNRIRKPENPATQLVAARLLIGYGDTISITHLAEKIFGMPTEKKLMAEYFDTYQTVLECIFRRGNERAFKLLERELVHYSDNLDFLNLILPAIPDRAASIFFDRCFGFLMNPDFPAPDALRKSLVRMPRHLLLPKLIGVLRDNRGAYPHKVRIETVKLLGELKEPYCLQILLESLPILAVEEAKEFSKLLADFAGNNFDVKVKELLSSADASIRAALIASLPATEKRDFLSIIRDSLTDADPGVRIASIWSLLDFNDMSTVNTSLDMLRDPVEHVRVEVARAIGSCATTQGIASLQEIIESENEVDDVKIAAIKGLGKSDDPSSVDTLCNMHQIGEQLRDEIETALSRKTSSKQLERLTENFKDAVPVLKEGISRAAALMKEKGEEEMVNLLAEGIESLKPYLAEILESTGYVEKVIRKLSHRNSSERREAARILALIETVSSFRGIVLAARDPDNEVRIQVVKALEKLETKEGKSILDELEKDPDRKVRKYTLWALERLKAKAL